MQLQGKRIHTYAEGFPRQTNCVFLSCNYEKELKIQRGVLG